MSDLKETRIKDALYKQLPVDSRKGRGGTYGYVKWQAVADRMNDVFGMNWSSNVESEEIIGDQIIVRVQVCAKDPVTDQLFCQEGYGGTQMRSTDEAGSAHKGAYSKALKDACKKWGVGLHLEEGTETNFTNIPTNYSGHEVANSTPIISTPAPTVPSVPSSAPPTSSVSAPVSAPPTSSVSAPVSAPVSTTPTPSGPPAQKLAPTPSAPTPTVPQPSTPMTPAMPAPKPSSAPTGSVSPAPVPSSTPIAAEAVNSGNTSPDAPGTINNVQEMAIKNLTRLSGIEDPSSLLADLISNPEVELTRQVTSLNDLSYTEAVEVIKAVKTLQ